MGPAPPKRNVKHYESVDILSSFQNVKSLCANVKSQCKGPLKIFWRRFWFISYIISHDGFVAFDSREVNNDFLCFCTCLGVLLSNDKLYFRKNCFWLFVH